MKGQEKFAKKAGKHITFKLHDNPGRVTVMALSQMRRLRPRLLKGLTEDLTVTVLHAGVCAKHFTATGLTTILRFTPPNH